MSSRDPSGSTKRAWSYLSLVINLAALAAGAFLAVKGQLLLGIAVVAAFVFFKYMFPLMFDPPDAHGDAPPPVRYR